MFSINVRELHIHVAGMGEIQMEELRRSLNHLEQKIMATSSELTATLDAMATRAEKVKAEILAALAVVNEGTTTAEQDAALARISAVIGGLDDLTVDAAPA